MTLPSFIKRFGPHNTSIILFADDTSVLTNDLNFMNLENKLSIVLKLMNEWFHCNMLSLNLDKTCCMKFSVKQGYLDNLILPMVIIYVNKMM